VMAPIHLRLLARDRDELIEELRQVIREVEIGSTLKTYVMSSSGKSEFLLEVEETDQTDAPVLADLADDQILNRRGKK
jgi:hypothetical protein